MSKKKALIQRSGIVAAFVTTIFVVFDGLDGTGVLAAIAANRATLEPLWTTALVMALASPSRK